MLDKEKLLQHIQEDGLRGALLLALNKAESVLRNHDTKYTDFLTPHEAQAVCEVLDRIADIGYLVSGGYEAAERKIIIIFPDYLEESMVDIPLALLEIRSTSNFDQLDHRDYLGSIMGMGLKREKIGDLLIHGSICQCILHNNLKDYILFQLSKVGRTSVQVKELELCEIIPPKIEYKTIVGNVASLRLDAVLSLAFKMARGEAQNLIAKDRVSINWGSITKPSYEVDEDDVISVKGKGRVIVASIEGKTKSDRTVIKLYKHI